MIRWRRSANVSRRAEPDRVPERRRQRLGGDHQRVDRRHGAPQAGQLATCSPRWPAPRPRPAPTPYGVATAARLQRYDRRTARRSATPRRSTGRGQAADQLAPGGCAAQCGGVRAAEHVRRVAARPRLARRQQGEARGRTRPTRRPRRGPARAAARSGRATTVPPLAKSQSMPSAAATRPTSSTVSTIARCIAMAAVPAVPPGERADGLREQRRAPAAVAAGRAEPGDLRFERRRSAASGRPWRGSRPSTAR